MAEIVKQILAKPIQLADQIIKAADYATTSKTECLEIKSKAEKLAALLRQAARASSELYERPTRRIIDDTEQVLEKVLALVDKCNANGIVKRLFTIIPTAAFRKMSSQLENSIGDVSWLLRVSASGDDRGNEHLGLPPIAANEPILYLIWEQIAILFKGSIEDKSDAAASLVSLARDNDRYGKLIIEEGGVGPLLKLVKEGRLDGQLNAAKAIGLLGRDAESVEHMINAGVCSVFAKVLKEESMKVQAMVAWAVSELASNHPKCQDHFAQNSIVRLLVGHLAFETVQEHSKYTIASNKPLSIHSAVIATNNTNNTCKTTSDDISNSVNDVDDKKNHCRIPHPSVGNPNSNPNNKMHKVVCDTMAAKSQSKPPSSLQNNAGNHHQYKQTVSLSGNSIKGREFEDPATKADMKAMAAKALWKLAKGNSLICRSITESRALLCFSILIEKGTEEVRLNCAMALMEITEVAEHDTELRRSAFKPNSPAAKAVVEQLLRIIEKADNDLLIPCVNTIGNLARTFKATETRIIGPLVRLLEDREAEVSREAASTLAKFACTENYLHLDHAKAIIEAGGVKHVIQLVYFGEQMVQLPALILLCYIALHVPDSEALAQAEVLMVLEWASKQGYMIQYPSVEKVLPEAKGRLELYQSRGSKGFR